MPYRIEVHRQELQRSRQVSDPAETLADGQARLSVSRFALTANNVTYAVFGEEMKYWQFFPASEPDWGVVPVWGYADVVESRAEGLEPGRRLYGYLPMGSHLIVTPTRLGRTGFTDGSPHREGLAAIYNRLEFAAPATEVDAEGMQAVLRPLFTTSFLIDDFLAQSDFFGARQIVLSSASSRTAWGLAFCLALRAATERPRIVGLTSATRVDDVGSLGCYDAVLDYADLETLAADAPTVYVDMAGDGPLRRRVHEHWADRLRHSAAVGGTHWTAVGGAGGLPGPRPTLFFAPAQAAKRAAAPPAGWGPDGLQQRLGQAWTALVARATDPARPWLRIDEQSGAAAIEAAWQSLVDGRSDPRLGLMLRP